MVDVVWFHCGVGLMVLWLIWEFWEASLSYCFVVTLFRFSAFSSMAEIALGAIKLAGMHVIALLVVLLEDMNGRQLCELLHVDERQHVKTERSASESIYVT